MPEFIDTNAQSDSSAIASLLDSVPEEVPDIQPGDQTPVAQPDHTPEAVVTPDPKVETPEFPHEEKELDEFLEKNFQAKTPNQQKALPVLKSQIKKLTTELREQREKAETAAKERDSIEPLTPELQSELDELRQLRKAEAPDKDPEIQAKYIAPLSQKEDQAMNILRNGGLADSVIDLIKEAGGLMKASNSDEAVPRVLSKNGESWSEWIEHTLLPKTTIGNRRQIESLLTDMLNLNDQMTAEVGSEKFHSEERQQAKFQRMGQEFQSGIDEVAKSLGPIAQKWEVKGTDEQKARAEAHNARLDKVIASIGEFQKGLSNPNQLGKMAATAGQAIYLHEVNADLMKRLEDAEKAIKERDERIEKIKGSSSSARTTNIQGAAQPTTTGVPKLANTKQAIDAYLREI